MTHILLIESSPIRLERHAKPLAQALADHHLDTHLLLLSHPLQLFSQTHKHTPHTLHILAPELAHIAHDAARLHAIPRLVTHTCTTSTPPRGLLHTATRSLARIASEHTPHHLTLTTDTTPPSTLSIPLPGGLGIPLDPFDPERADAQPQRLRARLQLHPTHPIVGFVDADLNPALLPPILRRLRRLGHPFQAIRILDAPTPPVPGLLDLPPSTPRHLAIAACDLLVQPTSRPADASSLMAAMAMRRPILAPDNPLSAAVITHRASGRLLPPQPEAYAKAIHALLRDPSLRSMMGSRGRASALSRFSQTLRIQRLIDQLYAD